MNPFDGGGQVRPVFTLNEIKSRLIDTRAENVWKEYLTESIRDDEGIHRMEMQVDK